MNRAGAATILASAFVSVLAAQAKNPKTLVGQTATLCGPVVTFSVSTREGEECATRLDLARPFWRQTFYVFIPADALSAFSPAPDQKYVGQDVCVTGLVTADKKQVPHIVVTSPDQIRQTSSIEIPPFGGEASRLCEKGMVPPKLVKSTEPTYPRNLLSQGVEGHVLMQAVIGTDGGVTKARVIYADEGFRSAAEDAVKAWRFRAATRDGVPVSALLEIEVTFKRS